MKFIIGLLLVIAGVILGLYVGVVVCFVGGIIDVVNQLKSSDPVEAAAIAWGIAKIVFASLIGWLSALILIIPGWGMMFSD